MLLRNRQTRIVDGKEVVVGISYSTLKDFLSNVIVESQKDIERVQGIVEAWMRFEMRRTQVEFTLAEQEDLRAIIGMGAQDMRVIEHEPVKAIPHRRQEPIKQTTRVSRWHD